MVFGLGQTHGEELLVRKMCLIKKDISGDVKAIYEILKTFVPCGMDYNSKRDKRWNENSFYGYYKAVNPQNLQPKILRNE